MKTRLTIVETIENIDFTLERMNLNGCENMAFIQCIFPDFGNVDFIDCVFDKVCGLVEIRGCPG